MVLVCVGIAAGLFLTDVVIKQHVEDNMKKNKTHEIAGGKIEIRKVHNHGFAFNLLDHKPYIVKMVSVTTGVLLACYQLWLLCRKGRFFEKLGGAIALGGAFSNMYDRVVRGYVVDYFGFKSKWKKFRRLTFNIGDVCLVLGAVISVLSHRD